MAEEDEKDEEDEEDEPRGEDPRHDCGDNRVAARASAVVHRLGMGVPMPQVPEHVVEVIYEVLQEFRPSGGR